MWLLKRIVYLVIILVALLIGYVGRKRLNKPLQVVWVLLLVTFCVEAAAVVLAYFKNNTFIYHLFNPVEVCLWGIAYFHLFGSTFMKYLTVLLGTSVMALMIVNTIWFQQIAKQSNNYSVVAESLFLLVVSLFYFRDMLRNTQEENILCFSLFWLNCAVLFFYSINILFWTADEWLNSNDEPLLRTGFELLYYSNYVFYATIGFSFWLQLKQHHSPKNRLS